MEEGSIGNDVEGGRVAIDTSSEEGSMLASMSLYLCISSLIALSSPNNDWTCCCKDEIAPMHP